MMLVNLKCNYNTINKNKNLTQTENQITMLDGNMVVSMKIKLYEEVKYKQYIKNEK